MAADIETIKCSFIGDFQVADNIAASSQALCRLSATNEGAIFNKLIVIQAGSIVEAALDQIIYRAKYYTSEGLETISDEALEKIRESELDKFYHIIEAMKKYKILDELGEGIYVDLHSLREFRNRVHIQNDNKPKGVHRDDRQAFNNDVVKFALSLCIQVLKGLVGKHPRPEHLLIFARDISIPKS